MPSFKRISARCRKRQVPAALSASAVSRKRESWIAPSAVSRKRESWIAPSAVSRKRESWIARRAISRWPSTCSRRTPTESTPSPTVDVPCARPARLVFRHQLVDFFSIEISEESQTAPHIGVVDVYPVLVEVVWTVSIRR